MKLYSKKLKRHVERQIHFGIGKSTMTACGLVLFSRHVMVSLHSGDDGAIITDDLSRVTCKRCLKTNDVRLRTLIAIEKINPGIFDRDSLCGEQWLLEHALDVSPRVISQQKLDIHADGKNISLFNSMKSKDRKYILRNLCK